MTETGADNKKKRDLVVTRVFDAPVEVVWRAWSDAQLLMRWWGPDLFTSPGCEIDFREGGTSLVCMRSAQGDDFYSIWKYQKIVPFQSIEFIQNLADERGNPIDPAAVGMPPEFPRDTRTIVVFRSLGSKSQITITQYDMPSSHIQIGKFAEIGLNQTIDKMVGLFKR